MLTSFENRSGREGSSIWTAPTLTFRPPRSHLQPLRICPPRLSPSPSMLSVWRTTNDPSTHPQSQQLRPHTTLGVRVGVTGRSTRIIEHLWSSRPDHLLTDLDLPSTGYELPPIGSDQASKHPRILLPQPYSRDWNQATHKLTVGKRRPPAPLSGKRLLRTPLFSMTCVLYINVSLSLTPHLFWPYT